MHNSTLKAALVVLLVAGIGAEAAPKSWKFLGVSAGVTPKPVDDLHMALDPVTGAPFLAFTSVDPINAVFVRLQTSVGFLRVGEGGLTETTGFLPRIAIPPAGSNQPFVAYADGYVGNRCSVKRWNGTDWVYLGGQALASQGAASYINIDASSALLTPLVAYADAAVENKASAVRLNNVGQWENLGPAGFTPGSAEHLSLAVYQGVPWVAFKDGSNPDGLGRVMRWDAGREQWSNVGKLFSKNEAGFISLAVNTKTAEPWVFYTEVLSGNLSVVSYSLKSKAWVAQAPNGFSFDSESNSLAFDSAGNPVLAYQCDVSTRALCVRTLANKKWVMLGKNLSTGMARGINLAISKGGQLYVSYIDSGRGNKPIVRVYS